MTAALIAGAILGVGIFLLFRALFPSRPGLAASLAAYDSAVRRRQDQALKKHGTSSSREQLSGLRAELGRMLAALYDARGWQQRTVRADLAILDKSFEAFLATKFLLPSIALLLMPLLAAYCYLLGVSLMIPLWVGLLVALFFFVLPDMQLRDEAAARRRDFRHVVGAFLDLVALNLAGGRGVPEALMSAAQIGDGWAIRRIRDSLANARITGQTPWNALGTLGEEINVAELRDLAAALTLVADDGAKVRQSLAARAASMRSREMSEIEGKAGERSQSMLLAQLLLCVAFLVFLIFPAVERVIST